MNQLFLAGFLGLVFGAVLLLVSTIVVIFSNQRADIFPHRQSVLMCGVMDERPFSIVKFQPAEFARVFRLWASSAFPVSASHILPRSRMTSRKPHMAAKKQSITIKKALFILRSLQNNSIFEGRGLRPAAGYWNTAIMAAIPLRRAPRPPAIMAAVTSQSVGFLEPLFLRLPIHINLLHDWYDYSIILKSKNVKRNSRKKVNFIRGYFSALSFRGRPGPGTLRIASKSSSVYKASCEKGLRPALFSRFLTLSLVNPKRLAISEIVIPSIVYSIGIIIFTIKCHLLNNCIVKIAKKIKKFHQKVNLCIDLFSLYSENII
jgi:hypothetical protein